MSQGGTQIVVALIGVVGVVSAAVIANHDKLFGNAEKTPTAVAQPAPTETAPANAAAPAAKVEALSDAQGAVIDESTSALERIATQISGASTPDISGQWRDADGYSYAVEQKGGAYAYRQYQNGSAVGAGEGQISGGTLRHVFTSVYGPGECVGEVSADGGSITGLCGNGTNQWPFQITRSAAAD